MTGRRDDRPKFTGLATAALGMAAAATDAPHVIEKSCRVLVIDDDADLNVMLKEYLEADGFDVAFEDNGVDGLAAALSESCDVVVLDVILPRLNGMDLLRLLRERSDVPVLVLSAQGGNDERIVGLECGADDYLGKPYDPRELVARIKAVARRNNPRLRRPNNVLALGPVVIHFDAHQCSINGQLLALTVSEFRLITVLVRVGDVVSTKDMPAQDVMGRPIQPYDRSLDIYIKSLRSKIASVSSSVKIDTIRGQGYKLRLG